MTLQRIAFVSPRYPSDGAVGGAETLLKNLAEHLASSEREVHFLTTCAKDHHSWENTIPPQTEIINGLNVHYFEVDQDRDLNSFLTLQERISRKEKLLDAEEKKWMANSIHSQALYTHLENEKYDHIIVGPYLLGLTFKTAYIHPDKTFLVPCLHDEGFAYLNITCELFHNVKGLIFNTHPEKDLAEYLYEIPPEKGKVVGMGMTPFDVDKKRFADKHNLKDPYIIYCGRREGLKGTPLLCAYMQTFIERTERVVKLVFTGSGSIEADAELESQIIDLGYVSEQEKQEALGGALAFVHPSANESFGIVLLEAWLAQTPCLVYSSSTVLVTHCRRSRGGFWFANYPEFEVMLLKLLDEPNLCQALGEAGREYVLSEYSWENIGKKIQAVLT